MAPQDSEGDGRRPGLLRQLGLAMELPFTLIAAVLIGGACGYLLDRWLGISPALMLLGGLAGFGLGIRDVVRRLSRAEREGNGR
jgi:F0F1-type ATP synthase assembly protein I